MSYKVRDHYLNDRLDITSHPQLMMLEILADYADSEGEKAGFAFPSMGALAKRLRRDKRTAQLLINKLEEAGEIVVVAGAGQKTARGTTNGYYLVSYLKAAGLPVPGVPKKAAEVRSDQRSQGRKGREYLRPSDEGARGETISTQGRRFLQNGAKKPSGEHVITDPVITEHVIEGESSYRVLHCDQPTAPTPPIVTDSADFDGPRTNAPVKAKATEHQKHLKLPKWLSEHIDTSKLVTDEEGNRNIPRNSGTTPFEVYLEFYPFDPKKMSGAKAYRIAEVVNDLPRWRTVVRDWFDGDHNPNNFRDMFDVYRNGWRNGGNVTAGAVSEDGTMVVNFQGRDITVPPNFVGYVRDGDKETRERYLGLLLSRVRNGVTDASRPAGH